MHVAGLAIFGPPIMLQVPTQTDILQSYASHACKQKNIATYYLIQFNILQLLTNVDVFQTKPCNPIFFLKNDTLDTYFNTKLTVLDFSPQSQDWQSIDISPSQAFRHS